MIHLTQHHQDLGWWSDRQQRFFTQNEINGMGMRGWDDSRLNELGFFRAQSDASEIGKLVDIKTDPSLVTTYGSIRRVTFDVMRYPDDEQQKIAVESTLEMPTSELSRTIFQGNPLGLPGLTTAERDSLSSITAGSIIWNTTDNRIEVYTGSAWNSIQTSQI